MTSRTTHRRAAGVTPVPPAARPGEGPPPTPGPSGPLVTPPRASGPDPESSPQCRVPAADRERRSAGMPHPETGAEGPCTTASAPVRARALQAPSPALLVGTPDEGTAETRLRRGGTAAGSVVDADATLPADPRTYTIALPAGLKLLSLNGREHWSERARRTEALKKAAWAMTLQGKVPRLGRASIVVEYQPPDRRRRDADNPAPSAKACIDGIVAAGVLEDDACPRYVTGIHCTIGQPYPKGRLVLHVTEVAATGGGDDAA